MAVTKKYKADLVAGAAIRDGEGKNIKNTYATKQEVEDNEEVIASALNELNNSKAAINDINARLEASQEKIQEVEEGLATIDEIEDELEEIKSDMDVKDEVIAQGIADLNTRLELMEKTDSVTAASLADLNYRLELVEQIQNGNNVNY